LGTMENFIRVGSQKLGFSEIFVCGKHPSLLLQNVHILLQDGFVVFDFVTVGSVFRPKSTLFTISYVRLGINALKRHCHVRFNSPVLGHQLASASCNAFYETSLSSTRTQP
jgi:hypothetical protein